MMMLHLEFYIILYYKNACLTRLYDWVRDFVLGMGSAYMFLVDQSARG